tara:strand:+ start:4598 stop:5296 length:699 start_codon:yes stop_codon:yes gene_type:complete
MRISDRTLMVVGFITFLITLSSVSVIMLKVGGVDGITGFAVTNKTTATVNVTVVGAVSLTLVNSTVIFDSGTLKLNGDTNGGTRINSSVGTNEGSGFSEPTPFHLRNDGNVFINVTINGSAPEDLFGVSSGGLNYSFAAESMSPSEVLGGTCGNYSSGSGSDNQFSAIANATRPFGVTMPSDTNFTIVCPNMSYSAGSDEFNVTIYMNITENVGNGTYSDTIEFMATSHAHS